MSAASPLTSSAPGNLVQFPSARLQFLSYLEKLASLERELIDDLSNQSVEEIIDTRAHAHLLTKTGWRVEVACDAAIWNRESDKRSGAGTGRGNKDVDAIGLLAAVARRAKIIGCTPRTIYKNKQIFALMEKVVFENYLLDALPLKEFWTAALRAADPVEAVRIFAGKRTENPKFKVSEAYRLLDSEQKTIAYASLKAVEKARENQGTLEARTKMINHLKRTVELLEGIPGDCPDPVFSGRMYSPLRRLAAELNDHLDVLFDEDAMEAMRQAWDAGHSTESAMSTHTGFPPGVTRRIMRLLSDMDEFFPVEPIGGKDQQWQKAGVPLQHLSEVGH